MYQIHAIAGKIGREAKKTLGGIQDLVLRATTESLKPRWIVFEATDACNSRCVHCNIWRRKPKQREESVDVSP